MNEYFKEKSLKKAQRLFQQTESTNINSSENQHSEEQSTLKKKKRNNDNTGEFQKFSLIKNENISLNRR